MSNYPTLYGFKFATGDVNPLDYGATWVRPIGERSFHFIRLINWEDSCCEKEAKEVGYKYNMQLSEVDLADIGLDRLLEAFESQGNTEMLLAGKCDDAWQALTCLEYGCYAPLNDVNTSNFHKTFRLLARESRQLTASKEAHDRAMSKRVNRLGSTAREYMQGDIDSAVERGLAAGDDVCKLVAKIQGRQEVSS